MKTPLLLASALLLGACTSTDPDYGSHWNAGQAAVSAEHAFTGFDAEVSESRFEHQRDGVISTGYVAATGLTMATDVIVGVPLAMFGVDYGGVSGFCEDGDTAPTPPEEFQTVNF